MYECHLATVATGDYGSVEFYEHNPSDKEAEVYGTVARFRLKPGSEAQLFEGFREFEAARVPGYVANYIYRMDADPQVYYLAAAFESKEA
jgi:hypothetical protein